MLRMGPGADVVSSNPADGAVRNDPEPTSVPARVGSKAGRSSISAGSLDSTFTAILVAGFGAALAVAYLSALPQGLFDDGYFVKRFAYNFLHHGAFSWNVADGPVYGMTSQTLQLIGTLLAWVAPEHVFTSLKAVLFGAIVLTALAMYRLLRAREVLFGAGSVATAPQTITSSESTAGLIACISGLAMTPIAEAPLVGLETTIGLCAVALSLWAVLWPIRGWQTVAAFTGGVVLVYVTRPDAAIIPCIVLLGRALYCWRDREQPSSRRELGQILCALAGTAVVLALVLAACRAYYGTALPLPFYVKTHGLSPQPAEYVAHFSKEKTANALQALLIALPHAFIALHDRSRLTSLLLIAGLTFGVYHYVATIETMGYLSRFYLPGLIPIFIASGLAYRSYQLRQRWALSVTVCAVVLIAFVCLKVLDDMPPALRFYIPAWFAMTVMLLGPPGYNPLRGAATAAILLAGALINYPIEEVRFEDDDTLLLRQTRKRGVFSGMERLRAIEPKSIYHTDMGAPGALFLEARVVDLDGLLNEDITLRGARFDDLCKADRPDAIYVPNEGYQQLRQEVLASACLSDYRAVTSSTKGELRLRRHLVKAYRRTQ